LIVSSLPEAASASGESTSVDPDGSTIVADVSPESLSAEALRGCFQGRLVRLEPLALAHAEGLRAAATDSDMFAWMPVDMASSDAALNAWLTDSLALAQDGGAVPYAILAADSGRVFGSTRFLELRFEHLRAEIGWSWVTRPAWGTGVNVETKLLLLEHAFERVGLRRVEFKTDARNARSRGALLALGASFEGILRTHMVVAEGGRRDSAYFSVIDEEWPAVKQRLHARLASP